MSYAEINRCRICGNQKMFSIIHLGTQTLTGVFPNVPQEEITRGPLELIKCDEEQSDGCGLVQLRHSYDSDEMYRHNYGYRSSLNKSMVNHLNLRVQSAVKTAKPSRGDLIIDIGCNDATLLRAYPESSFLLVGVDPTGEKFKKYYPSHVTLIPDYFSAATVEKRFPRRKAKIITSIAMFYDLEDPMGFVAEVSRLLDEEGIWILEQSYLPLMLERTAYDTICHEHLEYYALKQILYMAEKFDLKLVDVEVNEVNGGSFCIYLAKKKASYEIKQQQIENLLEYESSLMLNNSLPYEKFRKKVFVHRQELRSLVQKVLSQGKTIYGYGASTKGNVILQFCGFSSKEIPAIAEVNQEKFGAFTPGTLIPIVPEADIRMLKPDYLLVLPWHFREGIIEREATYLNGGGKLIFPLPEITVVSRSGIDHLMNS